ncbi:translation initiation factor IF-2 [Psittacicella hinzii]|uniref:Translation initiation factor IF-2 n=1 Tax=Psittacicella hinzii TaxID=2028575 RepID=A0A3A1YFQ2_9GAMM|nr:translation initiation factor IF-2 [Psittacicella hinzii]RIY35054.1 translation initiation factor IF-2 [Psittacicella hinzii]
MVKTDIKPKRRTSENVQHRKDRSVSAEQMALLEKQTNEAQVEKQRQKRREEEKQAQLEREEREEQERIARLEQTAKANLERQERLKRQKAEDNKNRKANKANNNSNTNNNGNNNNANANSNGNNKFKGNNKKSNQFVDNFSKNEDNDDYSKYSSKYAKDAEVEEDRRSSKAGKRRQKGAKSKLKQSFKKPEQPVVRDVVIGETITVSELSNRMAVKAADVIKFFMNMGEMVTINQVLPQETAVFVAEEMGHKVIKRNDNDLEQELLNASEVDSQNKKTITRAPVVTIMGHVDHGKTSLLDYIRKTRVASGEAGGITQHIGAYHVTLPSGRDITFLDTPGHAAFTSMRARGAKATDIVVLVVAADDGVMPQTIEAIQHARAAKVPIIVAVNKIDKPEANPEKVRNELIQYGVIAEELGGDEIFVNVSAKTGKNVDDLLETIALQAEVLELKATTDCLAQGVVIESFLDKGRGPVATVLVQNGTLNKGDIILCGLEYGKIRAMRNDLGKEVVNAGPSIPVEVLGLSGVPSAGDEVTVVTDERKAREVALYRQGKFKEIKLARQQKAKLENLFANAEENKASELNIVLKADVQGSVEAISDALYKLSTDEVKVNIIASGVGGISETDATLALASSAIIIGFNVRADASARAVIEREHIDLRYYSIIYDLINEVKQAMSGLLEPEYKQEIIGLAEVRDVFRAPKYGQIAGCMVTEGIIKRNNPIRVLRDNIVIYEGSLESLRRFKDDVSEVRAGNECGIGVRNYNDVRIGDQIEVYEEIRIERSI